MDSCQLELESHSHARQGATSLAVFGGSAYLQRATALMQGPKMRRLNPTDDAQWQQGYDDGYGHGRTHGYQDGHTDQSYNVRRHVAELVCEDSFEEGWEHGYEAGYKDGYQHGFELLGRAAHSSGVQQR